MLIKIYRAALVLAFLWLLGNTAVSAQQQLARQADLDKVEQQIRETKAQVDAHILSDYKNFNALYSVDSGKLADLNTRLAVMESTMATNTRILWGIVAAVALQLLQVFFGLFRVDITKRQK